MNEQFEVVFLTMWSHEEIDTLLSVLMVEKYMKSLHLPGFRSANWRSDYEDKTLWVVDAIAMTGTREWLQPNSFFQIKIAQVDAQSLLISAANRCPIMREREDDR